MVLHGGDTLRERRLSAGDDLPQNISIPESTLHDVPVTIALEAVLAGTGIMVTPNGIVEDRQVTLEKFSGTLPDVVRRICDQVDIFCTYRQGALELNKEAAFVVSFPAENGNMTSVVGSALRDMLDPDTSEKIQIDLQGNSLIYTVGRADQDKIHSVFQQIREGHPLIAMQVFVWDVTLDEQNRKGIPWNSFQSGNPGRDVTYEKPEVSKSDNMYDVGMRHVNVSDLAEFLARQGHLKNISHSEIAFIANTDKPELPSLRHIGHARTDMLNDIAVPDISAMGTYDEGIISANFHLVVKNQHQVKPVGNEQYIDTLVRAHPGDNLVLAGDVVEPSINGSSKKKLHAHQIVIALKPFVYLTQGHPVDVASPAARKAASQHAVTHQFTPEWPDPILIDKDGVQPAPAVSSISVQTPAFLPKSRIDQNAPAAIIYDNTNAAVLENRILSSESEESQ